MISFRCEQCGKGASKSSSAVNRARRDGLNLYCDRACAGLGRRAWKSSAAKKAAKREYDAKRRVEKAAQIKAKKAAYHKRKYDPTAAAEARKCRMPWHLEYCRRPGYREKKAVYDLKRRAGIVAGEFWESHVLLLCLEQEVLSRSTRYELGAEKGTINKALNRRRDYERQHGPRPHGPRPHGYQPQERPVGHAQQGQERHDAPVSG